MSVFITVYEFIYNWLFGAGTDLISVQSQEMATLLLTCTIVFFILYIAILPIKAVLSLIFRGW